VEDFSRILVTNRFCSNLLATIRYTVLWGLWGLFFIPIFYNKNFAFFTPKFLPEFFFTAKNLIFIAAKNLIFITAKNLFFYSKNLFFYTKNFICFAAKILIFLQQHF